MDYFNASLQIPCSAPLPTTCNCEKMIFVQEFFENDFLFQVVNGYFVHFFAPQSSPTLLKHVIFVLDTSGDWYEVGANKTRHVPTQKEVEVKWTLFCIL